MTRRRMHLRAIGLVLLSTHLAACTVWHIQKVAPAQVIAERHPDAVRVTRSDRSRLVLRQPTIVGDTMMGAPGSPAGGGSLRVPMDDVRLLETRHLDAGRTIAVVVGVPAVALGTFLLLCTGECLQR